MHFSHLSSWLDNLKENSDEGEEKGEPVRDHLLNPYSLELEEQHSNRVSSTHSHRRRWQKPGISCCPIQHLKMPKQIPSLPLPGGCGILFPPWQAPGVIGWHQQRGLCHSNSPAWEEALLVSIGLRFPSPAQRHQEDHWGISFIPLDSRGRTSESPGT